MQKTNANWKKKTFKKFKIHINYKLELEWKTHNVFVAKYLILTLFFQMLRWMKEQMKTLFVLFIELKTTNFGQTGK